MVVCSSRHFDVMISHSDIVGVGCQIFGCSHDGELNSPLVAEGLVCPFPDGTDLFDGGDTIVGNQDLGRSDVSMSVFRPRPCCPVQRSLTFVMTVCPSWAATKSFILDGDAFSSRLPPMKWSATLCFSTQLALPLATGTVRLPLAAP